MIEATLFLLLLGLVASVMLAVASKVFYVKEDPRVLEIMDVLPGANCGGCGYAGCAAAAEAIAAGKAPANVCVAGGFEVAVKVGAIMGVEVKEQEPEFAWTSCSYGVEDADRLYDYNGALDCKAAMALYGGSKVCPIGCLGLGTCVQACQFDALRIGDEGLPVVDTSKCVGCGACVKACPKGIITLTSATKRIVAEYTVDECTAPCQRACPTGIDIPQYIAHIREGRYEQAVLTIKEKCPLPLVCGRICPAPCELSCRRNLVDEPVAINGLKRFVADYEMRTGKRVDPYKAPDTGKRVAIVGGGAEGLTTAYYLARLGVSPTILESRPQLGGILRYVISEDRLPRDVLDFEIQGVLGMGVEARTGQALGRDVTLGELLEEGFDAVALCSGGYDSRKLLQPLEAPAPPVGGVQLLFDFLMGSSKGQLDLNGRGVLVVGAAPSSLKAARACKEAGASMVTIVTAKREMDLEWGVSQKDLEAEGIHLRTETVVVGLSGEADRLQTVEMAPLGDLSAIETIEAALVVLAAPRLPELVFAKTGQNGSWETVRLFETLPSGGDMGLFSTPEPGRISDAEAVVKAILSGRRLARAVSGALLEGRVPRVERLVVEAPAILDVDSVGGVSTVPRERPQLRAAETGTENDWLEDSEIPGLTEEQARREAERCLQCGLICYRKTATEEAGVVASNA